MSAIDDFFNSNQEQTHPLLRSVAAGLAEDVEYQLDLQSESYLVGLSRVKMFVSVVSQPGIPPTEYDWSKELNSGLIQMRIRAVDDKTEAFRFALILRDSMEEIENRHGNGFFNSVLVDLVRDSGLDEDEDIREMLNEAVVNPTNRSGGYEICRDSIALAIRGRAKELTQHLGYSEAQAKVILNKAISMYIDDRFSVTSRRQMGFL